LIEISLLVLEKIFEKSQCIFTLLLSFPLGEGQSPHFNNLEFPPPRDDLCKVWLKLAQWFWRKSRKCKSLQTDGQSVKLTRAFSSGELKKKGGGGVTCIYM
jgi:hypothetical protein